MTKPFAFKAYAIAFITLLLGMVLSLKLSDWTWLSRAGSLIVINGIILTSHQIIHHIQRLQQNQIHWQSQFNRDWAAGDKHHFIYDSSTGIWMDEKYGFYMLIVGTFVWGFGDLLNYF